MEAILTCGVLAAIVGAINLFFAWIIQILWNWLLVDLFGFPSVDYWQALGIMVLLSIVGGFFKSSTSKK